MAGEKAGFFHRLKDYYISIGAALATERDISAVLPNPTDKGLARESAYAEILRQLLPASCQVSLGGYLFGPNGDESRQMDVLVYSDLSLQYLVGTEMLAKKAFTCVDGAIGAVAVKSRLDRAEVADALSCIASIPDKLPLEGRVAPVVKLGGYADWPYKVVVAFDGLAGTTILQHVDDFYEAHPEIPQSKRPNLIHTLGGYCIARTAEQGEETRLGVRLAPNQFVLCANDPDFLGLAKVVTGMHKVATAMRWIMTDYADIFDKTPLRE